MCLDGYPYPHPRSWQVAANFPPDASPEIFPRLRPLPASAKATSAQAKACRARVLRLQRPATRTPSIKQYPILFSTRPPGTILPRTKLLSSQTHAKRAQQGTYWRSIEIRANKPISTHKPSHRILKPTSCIGSTLSHISKPARA